MEEVKQIFITLTNLNLNLRLYIITIRGQSKVLPGLLNENHPKVFQGITLSLFRALYVKLVYN